MIDGGRAEIDRLGEDSRTHLLWKQVQPLIAVGPIRRFWESSKIIYMVRCTNLGILEFWKNISTFFKTWFLRRDLRFAGLHFAVRMAKILVYMSLSWDLWRNKRLEVKYIFFSRITEHVCNKVDLLLLLATYFRCLIIYICTVFKFILYSMLEVSFQWYSIVYPPNRKMYGWGWSPPGQVHGWKGWYGNWEQCCDSVLAKQVIKHVF